MAVSRYFITSYSDIELRLIILQGSRSRRALPAALRRHFKEVMPRIERWTRVIFNGWNRDDSMPMLKGAWESPVERRL